ncbi:hypothetical protein GCM10009037_10200 [Halarchaeum grantii]|uniref:DUF7981 domain-containing protein n=1 Tax=Halarchaeum grantii TaxID=1193105 RepID=A0A830F0K7_9EURY|nr:hypothetical protein [Halarchaeum grantii]GGL28504.1 hypothetical protein GCM10009037_10200 [Halarchaeum grantii]
MPAAPTAAWGAVAALAFLILGLGYYAIGGRPALPVLLAVAVVVGVAGAAGARVARP